MISFTSTRYDHVVELVANLRPADRAEGEAARGQFTAAQLWEDIRWSLDCVTALDELDNVVCVYGVSQHPMQEEVGIVWLLGTNLLDDHMFQLCKETKAVLKAWHTQFAILTNFTDKANTLVLRWLRWLGFAFGSEVEVRGHTFIQFTSHL